MLIAYPIAAIAASILVWLRHEPWYADIRLPGWTLPPAGVRWVWVAGLASTGVAALLLRDGSSRLLGLATALLWIQLATSVGWWELFHQAKRARTGFTVICLHWTAVGLATAAAVSLDPTAGIVMLPWLAAVAYVGAINFFVWQLESA